MTVSQSIITWLKTFNPREYWKMKSIDTDILGAATMSFALIKEPVTNTKKYLSGKKEHTDHYQIMARLNKSDRSDPIDNGAWLEALTDWISEQNEKDNFPALENAKVKQISVSSPFYMGQSEQDSAVYQLTVAIKYIKER